jgi:nicotinate-nucleotide adenylyltransferase
MAIRAEVCGLPAPTRRILSTMRAIMGGTFDPPHVAHLVAGEAAFQQLGVDVVTFTPAGSPWQKSTDGVSAAEDRWEMTRLAVAGVGYFEADDREVRREGWTYTIETLESYGDEEIVLILGADAAAGLASWHRGDEIMARAALAVVPRPGTDPAEVEQAIDGPFIWLDVPLLDISGTMLRQRSRAGGSIRFLVRDAVWRYVIEHDLYVAQSGASS